MSQGGDDKNTGNGPVMETVCGKVHALVEHSNSESRVHTNIPLAMLTEVVSQLCFSLL